MRKQDRQGVRTPADVERRFRGVPKVASDAQKRAAKAEQEVENLKHKKITVDQLDIEGRKLNIKVDATNIEGTVTAEQINADGISAKDVDISGTVNASEGAIGGWSLGPTKIPINVNDTIEENALTSPQLTDTVNGKTYSYQVYLTPKGVYISGQYSTSNEVGISYFANKTWLEILGEQI